jgi:prolyl 4-hydroxylase
MLPRGALSQMEFLACPGKMNLFYPLLLCILLNISLSLSEREASGNECDARPKALVVSKGKEMLVEEPSSQFEKKIWGRNGDQVYYELDEVKRIYYVPNFLNATTSDDLTSFCNGRFVSSPIRDKQNGDVAQDTDIRTSESCVLVPAALYLSNPRFLEMREKENPSQEELDIFKAVDVSWEVSRRAASLLSSDPTTVEPLQLVRYASPDAFYNVHHDHGGFYGKTTEHRPWTVLVFLNDVTSGGHTWFPKLELKVAPRAGDAIAWSNVDEEGKADPDMVHAGQPPGEAGIEKYAVNIWLGTAPMDKTNPALAGGQWASKTQQ